MKYLTIVLSLTLFLTACDSLPSRDRYQIVAPSDGNAYRLDKSNGNVWMIKGNTMEEVSTKNLRLTIGQRYTGADGYSFTYSGKGQFTEIKSLDEEMKKFWKDRKE